MRRRQRVVLQWSCPQTLTRPVTNDGVVTEPKRWSLMLQPAQSQPSERVASLLSRGHGKGRMHECCADPQTLLRAMAKLANVLGLALASSMLVGVQTDLCSSCVFAALCTVHGGKLMSTDSIDQASCAHLLSCKQQHGT